MLIFEVLITGNFRFQNSDVPRSNRIKIHNFPAIFIENNFHPKTPNITSYQKTKQQNSHYKIAKDPALL